MRMTFLKALVCVSCAGILVACSDDDAGTGAGGGGGNPATTTTSSSGPSSTTGSTTSPTGTTGTEIPDPVSQVNPSITALSFGADCMPIVADDPISGTIDVTYQNNGNAPGSIPLVEAELMLGAGATFTFELEPAESGTVMPQESVSVVHTKVVGSATSTGGSACEHCGTVGVLTVRWLNEMGLTMEQSVEVDPFGCAF